MLTYFARRTYDAEAAVDLVGETFAEAFAGRAGFRGEEPDQAAAWLYGIARHQLSGFFRDGAIERRALARLDVEPRALSEPELDRIEELAGLAALRRRVAECLNELPADQRLVLELRVLEELSYEQVARRLDVSGQTVRKRVSRALGVLATRLGTTDDELEEARGG